MERDSSTRQIEEIEALKTIYAEEFITKPNGSYDINILLIDGVPQSQLTVSFNFPSTYPFSSPPVFQVNAPWLKTQHVSPIEQKFQELYEQFKPDPVIFQWIEFLRNDVLTTLGITISDIVGEKKTNDNPEEAETEEPVVVSGSIKIMACTPVTDRKSKFQAFIAEVRRIEDVSDMMKQLVSNKKIAAATHNMYAYRIMLDIEGGKQLLENREDDGEGGGGDKILFVLQAKKAINLMVVVTRWYGGIHLGQARFKHIADCTTNALEKFQNRSATPELPAENTKKVKLRSSEAVYNQIKWDPEYDSSQCIMGYTDRFEGMQEISFEEWPTADIPFHRVWYFKLNGKVMWDRKKKEDLLKQS